MLANDQVIVKGVSIASTSCNASTHALTLLDNSSSQVGTLKLDASVPGSKLVANAAGGIVTRHHGTGCTQRSRPRRSL